MRRLVASSAAWSRRPDEGERAGRAGDVGPQAVAGLGQPDRHPPLDGVGDQRFDMIITNPPFHQGIGTDYDVVARFLQSCERHLHEDGVVLMVANRFLPYERMMPKALQMSLVAENTKFKILKGRLNQGATRRARPQA